MKKQVLRWVSVFLLLSVVAVGAITTLASNHRQLGQRVLQKNDLPQGSQYYAERLTQDRFLGEPFPANIPLQSKGFQDGYEVSAWYPLVLQNSSSDVNQGSAFILNVVYQYQDAVQATTAFEEQLKWFSADSAVLSSFTVEPLYYDQALDNVYGLRGSAWQLTYSQEGQTLVNYWFLGVKENTSILLMVDGLPDPATRQVFDTLMPKVMQR